MHRKRLRTSASTASPSRKLPFYAQVLLADPAANALGITLSNAAHGVIGL